MGKSKKKKNKDFQKVKLKVGRRLQKADNVTNASFRTRSVQVVQHIKAHNEEPSTKRNLNISDLLAQCQHYSISTRHDALTGLRELLTTHPQLLKSHLPTLLERVSQLFTDKDSAVRMAVIRLLKTILPNVPVTQIQPFFPVVSAYLCCAMTHIYDDIQADSLQVLDIFLDIMPSVVIQSSGQILPNFIEQISRQKSANKAESSRSLTVNPNSKLASQKWRSKVLERLHKLLSSIVTCGIKKDNSSPKEQSVKWDSSGGLSCQPFSSTVERVWKNHGFSFSGSAGGVSRNDSTKGLGISDEREMKKFVKTIVPLLMECWVVATTSQMFTATEGNLLSSEALTLRLNVVKVIQLLWRYIAETQEQLLPWLRNSYQSDCENHLLQGFPYSQHQGAKKKEKSSNNESAILSLNLGVCDIMTHFLLDSTNQDGRDRTSWLGTVCKYLIGLYSNKKGIEIENTRMYIQILSRLVDSGNCTDYLDRLYTTTIERYLSCHPLSSEKKEFLKFFASIIINSETSPSMSIQEQFFQSLPELFALVAGSNHQVAELILNTMKRSACHKCQLLLCEFVQEGLNNEALYPSLNTTNQSLFTELLFYLPHVDDNLMRILTKLCRNNNLPMDNSLYIIKCLNHRFWTVTKRSPEETAAHLSFLLSLALGEQKEVEPHSVNKVSLQFSPCQVVLGERSEVIYRSLATCETVCSMLKSFPNEEQVIPIVCQAVHKYVKSSKQFWTSSMSAALLLANHLQFHKFQGCHGIMPFLVDMLWGFLLAVGEFKCSNDTWKDGDFEPVMSICATFVSSDVEHLKEMCSNLTVSLRGVSCIEDAHVICEGALCILQIQKVKDKAIDLDTTELLKTMNVLKVRLPDLRNRQWWANLNFVLDV